LVVSHAGPDHLLRFSRPGATPVFPLDQLDTAGRHHGIDHRRLLPPCQDAFTHALESHQNTELEVYKSRRFLTACIRQHY